MTNEHISELLDIIEQSVDNYYQHLRNHRMPNDVSINKAHIAIDKIRKMMLSKGGL